MDEGRNLKQEIEEMGIIAIEDFGVASEESVFAALDAIREHNREYPEEKLLEMMEKVSSETG